MRQPQNTWYKVALHTDDILVMALLFLKARGGRAVPGTDGDLQLSVFPSQSPGQQPGAQRAAQTHQL